MDHQLAVFQSIRYKHIQTFLPQLKRKKSNTITHRNTHIAPRHTIPPRNINEPVPAENVVTHIDVAHVGQPAGHQVVAHHFDLGRRVQHRTGDEEHQAVRVAELESYELGVGVDRAGEDGGLLCDEPSWIEGCAGPASDARTC